MLAANVIVADTDDEARRLFTSMQRSFIDGAFRRQRTLLPPPIDSIEDYWQPHEKAQLEGMLSCTFLGAPDTVREGLDGFVAEHAPDELIVTTSAFDQAARLHSLEQLAGIYAGAAV
jgi:alkanesulfonate monooxygenase SsuD/methylene tetrahydromethanopterin reductase-like flavin-dependent oxidoreductase (luciferase family)